MLLFAPYVQARTRPAGVMVTAAHSLVACDWKNVQYALGPPAELQTVVLPSLDNCATHGMPSGPQVGHWLNMIAVAQLAQKRFFRSAVFGAAPTGRTATSFEIVTTGSDGGPTS